MFSIETKYYYTNQRIRDKQLRVIAGEGENLGVLDTSEALRIAQSRGLDLVVVSPNARPPVAKILDFQKFLYQERKERSKSKSRSKKSDTKEVRFKPFIGEGDLSWQIGRAREWLTDGNRVKVWVAMRGREAAHPEICFEKIEKFKSELEGVSKPEGPVDRKGNIISILLLPK